MIHQITLISLWAKVLQQIILFYFKVENLKMISGDYDVSVSSKSISHFKNKKLPIEYWIALEPDSTINK